MRTLVVICALILSGCSQGAAHMSNDEIIAETQKCESAGLEAKAVTYEFSAYITIQCRPKQ